MMKNLYKYLILAAAAVLALAACEDHRSDYMEEFQTMVYFRNGGEQDLTLFRTGEDGFYKIPVCKSGRNLEGTTKATVIPFSEAQLAIYNIKNESSYKLIPAEDYTFVDENRSPLASQNKVELSFGPQDAYQVVYLNIKTVAVSALMQADPDSEYVLGMQVFSEGNVSDDINIIVLRPDIQIPQLSFVNAGVDSHKYTSASPQKETYTNTLSLNMNENLWDFDCTLGIADAAWLANYNISNAKSYTLLPEGAFTLSSTTVHFAKGQLEVPFTVEIDRASMDMLMEYALPIVIKSCSKTEFAVNEKASTFILNVRLDPDQITLTSDMVSVSANHEGDGTGAPALVDGNVTTYWHSPWSGSVTNADPTYGIYVDIALKSPLKAIVLSYCTRAGNANGVPTHIVVGVSNDGASWTVLEGGDVATDEMASATAAQWITLPAMKHSSTFKYIRMGIAESVAGDLRLNYASSPKWTALSEIELYGTSE